MAGAQKRTAGETTVGETSRSDGANSLNVQSTDVQSTELWQRGTGPPSDADIQPRVNAPLPRRFGEYNLLEEVASGGMGVVYKAHQVKLDRSVAVKMIRAGQIATREDVERFITEARAAANLQHPNIVAIHEVGQIEGQHFFSMDYVEGSNLAELAREHPLPSKTAAGYLQKIAEAIDFAHQHDVLHRDVKPSNIIIDAQDQPQVTDFGLARRLDSKAELTATGQILGTPSYMPPEQALGEHGRVGPHSDVFSLGATLYAVITGYPPFRAESIAATLIQVLENEPVAPRLLNPGVDRDLETICLKCLQKQPAGRYASARELADDLARFLRGEPIHARRVSALERTRKWARRRPALAALMGLVVLFAVSLVAGVLKYQADLHVRNVRLQSALDQVERERRAAVEAQRDAETQRNVARAERNTAQAERNKAQQALQLSERSVFALQLQQVAGFVDRDPGRAVRELEDEMLCPPSLRDVTWGILYNRCRRDELTIPVDRSLQRRGIASALALAPNHSTIAAARQDGGISLFDTATKKERTILQGNPASTWSIAFSPDGRTLAKGGIDGTLTLWDVASGKQRWTRNLRSPPDGKGGFELFVAFSPNGSCLAVGGKDGGLTCVDVQTGEDAVRLPGHTVPVFCVAFSADGKLLASGGRDGTVKVWDLAAKTERASFKDRNVGIWGLALTPDGKTVATIGDIGVLNFRTVPSGEELATIKLRSCWLLSVAMSPDGRTLAVGMQNARVKLWDVATRTEWMTLSGHRADVMAVAFSSDSQRLASRSADGEVKLWNVARPEDTEQALLHQGDVLCTDFAPDGATLAAGCGERYERAKPGEVVLWDPVAGQERGVLRGHAGGVFSLAYSADGTQLATGSSDGTVKLWNTATHECVTTIDAQASQVCSVAFAPSGNFLAIGTGGGDIYETDKRGVVQVWDTSKNEQLATIDGFKGSVWTVEFDPSGNTLAAGSNHGTVILWSVADRRQLTEFSVGRGSANAVAFAPNGEMLAIASGVHNSPGEVMLWNVSSGEATATRTVHSGGVCCILFSPDGKTLVAGRYDGGVEFIDPVTGQERLVLEAHSRWVRAVTFSPDGQTLATGSGATRHGTRDGRIKLWRSRAPQ